MTVSQSLTLSSIDLLDLPVEVAEGIAQVVECRERVASASSAEAFETGLRDAMNGLGCKFLGAYAESRDDGANRIERDGQSWFRVAATPKTIMTTLGPVTFRRSRYRNDARSTSLVPVDESPGLIDDLPNAAGGAALADDEGSLHGAESGRVLREDGRNDAVGEHAAAADPEHA